MNSRIFFSITTQPLIFGGITASYTFFLFIVFLGSSMLLNIFFEPIYMIIGFFVALCLYFFGKNKLRKDDQYIGVLYEVLVFEKLKFLKRKEVIRR